MPIALKNAATPTVAESSAAAVGAARQQWPEWMPPEAAADYIDSSTSTLAKLRLKGGGPRFCRIGRAIRYRRHDLDDWLLSTRRRSTSDTGEAR